MKRQWPGTDSVKFPILSKTWKKESYISFKPFFQLIVEIRCCLWVKTKKKIKKQLLNLNMKSLYLKKNITRDLYLCSVNKKVHVKNDSVNFTQGNLVSRTACIQMTNLLFRVPDWINNVYVLSVLFINIKNNTQKSGWNYALIIQHSFLENTVLHQIVIVC